MNLLAVLTAEPVQAIVAINVLLTLSLLFPFMCGVWSLGMPGFMAVGAYVASVASVSAGLSLPATLALGALAGGLVTIPFGLLALRVRGIYLAIATLACAELVTLFFSHFQGTGGVMGFTGMPYVSGGTLLLIACIMALICGWLYMSRLGKVMAAVGSDPIVAACNGINVAVVQMTSLLVAGVLAGLAGGLYAHFYAFIAPNNFGFHRTVDILMFLVAGGLTPVGAIVGSTILTLLPQFASSLESWAPAIYGVVVILMMAFMPAGLLPRGRVSRWFRHPVGAMVVKEAEARHFPTKTKQGAA